MSNQKQPIYILRFFFDYGSGGCLWSGNDAAYEKFDVGTLDAETHDFDENVTEEARIQLPKPIKQKVLYLDQLFCESLNWDDPGGPSLWNNDQWEDFLQMAHKLHTEISEYLGNDFEIIYEQDDYRNPN